MKKFIFAVLVSAFVLTSTVYAEHGCPLKGGKCGHASAADCGAGSSEGCPIISKFMMKSSFILENKSELNLSEEQVKTIKDLKLQVEKSSIRMGANMQVGMLDMKAKLSEEKLDVEGLNKMIDEGMASMASDAKAAVAAYAKLKDTLTADQKTKMKQLWMSKR